MNYAVHWKHI